jgi:UDP-glucuronate decarboxylase
MCVDDGRVVSNFIVQALRGEPITIYGDGYQTRSFCHVDDLIRGILTVFHQTEYHNPINLGNPKEFTMLQLATKIIKLTKSKSKMVFMPLPQDDPTQRRPNITLARSLGWSPVITLDKGLPSVVYYFLNELGVSHV